jgi:hypothetical protein
MSLAPVINRLRRMVGTGVNGIAGPPDSITNKTTFIGRALFETRSGGLNSVTPRNPPGRATNKPAVSLLRYSPALVLVVIAIADTAALPTLTFGAI